MSDFDKQFISAEYKAGYDKGYAHGIRAASVCLLIVVACIIIFN